MANLYDLTSEYAAWQDALLSEDPEEAQSAMERLPELETAISDKADAYAKVIKNLQGMAAMYDNETKRLAGKKKACDNAVERLKNAMLDGMTTANIANIPTTIGKWSVKVNPPSVEVKDASLIPNQYLEQQEPKVRKDDILKWFKQTGEMLPGINIITDKRSVSFR